MRIELTFSKDELAILRKAQELLSNKTGGRLKETLLEMAKRTIKASAVKIPTTPAVAVKSATQSITPKIRREILTRDQCCQFKDPTTNKICGSKMYLEIDHVKPKYVGGSNEPTNLRMLCRNHNQYRFIERI